jgi:hypothetical protein
MADNLSNGGGKTSTTLSCLPVRRVSVANDAKQVSPSFRVEDESRHNVYSELKIFCQKSDFRYKNFKLTLIYNVEQKISIIYDNYKLYI